MTDECIHGFPTELCDICSPRQRPESEIATKIAPVRRTRQKSSLRSAPASEPRTRPSFTPDLPSSREFPALRAHHFTHVDNLAAIVADEGLIARAGAEPDFDVASVGAVQARTTVTIPDGTTAIDHVTFSLTPDGTAWNAVRSGAEDGRWSDAARRARATEFVLLVVPTPAFGDSVIVADGDPTLEDTRYAVGPDQATALLRRTNITDPDMRRVELLGGPRVPFSSVAVIGVANDRARTTVREILSAAGGHTPRVAVYPPWFVPSPTE